MCSALCLRLLLLLRRDSCVSAGAEVILETLSHSPRVFSLDNFMDIEEADNIIEDALGMTQEAYRLKVGCFRHRCCACCHCCVSLTFALLVVTRNTARPQRISPDALLSRRHESLLLIYVRLLKIGLICLGGVLIAALSAKSERGQSSGSEHKTINDPQLQREPKDKRQNTRRERPDQPDAQSNSQLYGQSPPTAPLR